MNNFTHIHIKEVESNGYIKYIGQVIFAGKIIYQSLPQYYRYFASDVAFAWVQNHQLVIEKLKNIKQRIEENKHKTQVQIKENVRIPLEII